MRRARAVAGVLAAALCACAAPKSGTGDLTQRVDGGNVEVLASGEPFATLHLTGGRIPYVWPLVGPGGLEVTRAFPMGERAGESKDHPHHQSMWFAHGDVNGHDFWHDPACTIEAVGEPRIVEAGPSHSSATEVDLVWNAPGSPGLLRETRRYVFTASETQRRVEVELVLSAPEGDVVFGDTKEGTFALRLRPELRVRGDVAAGSIVSSLGLVDDHCWGKEARWIAYSAPVGDRVVSVCLMDHPSNLRHPTRFHARGYGLVAANPFGEHGFGVGEKGAGDFRLRQGERLTLRYLVLLGSDRKGSVLNPPDFDAAWAKWTE